MKENKSILEDSDKKKKFKLDIKINLIKEIYAQTKIKNDLINEYLTNEIYEELGLNQETGTEPIVTTSILKPVQEPEKTETGIEKKIETEKIFNIAIDYNL